MEKRENERYPRHDGRVGDSQPSDTVDPEPGVDHGHPVGGRAHFARASLVILRPCVLTYGAPPIIVARVGVLRAGGQRSVAKRHIVLGQGGRVAQRQGYLDSVEEDGLVHRVGQVIPANHRLLEGIVAGQPKST